jgi:hypothetical protein
MTRKRYFILVFAIFIAIGFGQFAHAQTVGVQSPSVPAGLNATAMPPSQISVSWGSARESSGTIEGYYVYRNGLQVVTTAGTTFVDSSLNPGVYVYAVAAYDAKGNVSARSLPKNVSLISDTMPPTTPKAVIITGATSTKTATSPVLLTISWSASTDNVGVKGYRVYRDGTNITTSTSAALTATSMKDTVTAGTHSYSVAAYDASQNFSQQSTSTAITIIVDTNIPAVPANVSAQQVSAIGVKVSWATSTDNIGVAGYQVYRNAIQVASAAGPSYADNGLVNGKQYDYAVTAYDAAGNVSERSLPFEIFLRPVSKPSPPYGLSATLLGTSTVQLSWDPGVASLAITGYAVYRNGSRIALATSTGYLNTGLASGTYVYDVSATDVSGAISPTSSSASVIVPVVKPISITASSSFVAQPTNATPTAVVASSSVGSMAFTESLYFGLRAAQVATLQQRLVADGFYSGPVTGYYGTLTEVAVEKFQTAHGIAATGYVGPSTRAALNEGE